MGDRKRSPPGPLSVFTTVAKECRCGLIPELGPGVSHSSLAGPWPPGLALHAMAPSRKFVGCPGAHRGSRYPGRRAGQRWGWGVTPGDHLSRGMGSVSNGRRWRQADRLANTCPFAVPGRQRSPLPGPAGPACPAGETMMEGVGRPEGPAGVGCHTPASPPVALLPSTTRDGATSAARQSPVQMERSV